MPPAPKSRKSAALTLLTALLIAAPASAASSRWASSVFGVSSEFTATSWSASQALGPPDAWPAYGDMPLAWGAATADAQREYLELGFDAPAPINFVAVFETYHPGAIDSVSAWNPVTNAYEVVWAGGTQAAGDSSRVWAATFPTTSFAVSRIRISLNSPAVLGWNEIDAVAIGEDAISMVVPRFASTAQASSAYHASGSFSPGSATGAPNFYPGYGDNGGAWASLTADGSREWLQLDYGAPVFASGVRVYETFSPGAIDSLYLRDADDGSLHLVYSATPASLPAVATLLHLTFPATSYRVDGVRLTLASNLVPTWNEIDAVALDVDSLLVPVPPVSAVPITTVLRTIALAPARPSPFAGATAITFTLAHGARARLAAYDVRGARVRTLADGVFAAGPHAAGWDGTDDAGRAAPPGLYFLRLEAEGEIATSRVVRLR